MRTGLTISGVGHAAVLLGWGVPCVVQPLHAEPIKGLPGDVISATEFSQMTSGAKNAPRAENPKPVADKVAEAIPVDDPMAKLAKKEVKAAADVPPVPEPKPPEPKLKKPPHPPAPTDPIAEALKKDEDKKPDPKKAAIKTPAPPRKPAAPAPQFDPRKVEALLDKRDSQRVASASNEINHAVSIGVSGSSPGPPPLFVDPAVQLSQR